MLKYSCHAMDGSVKIGAGDLVTMACALANAGPSCDAKSSIRDLVTDPLLLPSCFAHLNRAPMNILILGHCGRSLQGFALSLL